jgi:hypothetical protein
MRFRAITGVTAGTVLFHTLYVEATADTMFSYTVDVPQEDERGIRVTCEEHDESEEFQPGYSTVTFHCEHCGYEIEITAHDLHEWRDFGEMC